jgi:hypothetical protein
MKALRTGLSMEQRYDVLNKVMPYRGGKIPPLLDGTSI